MMPMRERTYSFRAGVGIVFVWDLEPCDGRQSLTQSHSYPAYWRPIRGDFQCGFGADRVLFFYFYFI